MKRNAGFTLIELLVVLAILVALSMVALRSTTGLEERTRFDATSRALENAAAAIAGARDASEAGSYLTDVGALPDFSDPDTTRRLVALWRQPAGLALNQLREDGSDPEVRLSCGWRGPYLRLPTGRDPATTDVLQDGWGNPIALVQVGDAWQLVSPGSDGLFGVGTESAADIALNLPPQVERAELTGVVEINLNALETQSAWEVVVQAYVPDPTSGALRMISEGPAHPIPANTPSPILMGFSFTGPTALTPGMRVVRAYVNPLPVAPPDVVQKRSRLGFVTLRRGAQEIELHVDLAP